MRRVSLSSFSYKYNNNVGFDRVGGADNARLPDLYHTSI